MNRILTAALAAMVIVCGGCAANKAQQGAVVGGLGGALAGSLLAGNKVQGAAIGAGAGLLIGYIVGNEMDKADAAKLSDTLETGRSGKTVAWTNPDTGTGYRVTPQPAYARDEKVCRNVDIATTGTSGPAVVKGVACREPDGSWLLE